MQQENWRGVLADSIVERNLFRSSSSSKLSGMNSVLRFGKLPALEMKTIITKYREAPMKCPIDGSELVRQTYEANIEVENCQQCGGMWLDQRELESIQASREHDYKREINQFPNLVGQAYAMALAKTKPATQCPRCGQAMERREHGGCSQVLIDVCPHCRGVWLDQGEIEALEVFFEKANVETADMRSGFFASLRDFFN